MTAALRCCGFEFYGRKARGVTLMVSAITAFVAILMTEKGINLLSQHHKSGNMNQLWFARVWLVGGGVVRTLGYLFVLYLVFSSCGFGPSCYDHCVLN